MTDTLPHPWSDLDFIGGQPALDFTNTVRAWESETPVGERLTGVVDAVHWGEAAGLLTPDLATRLLAAADAGNRDPAVERYRSFRASLRRLFAAVADGEALPTPALADLNRTVAEAATARRVVATADGFAWAWYAPAFTTPVALLWPVAQAAADLLTDMDPGRLRVCPGDQCGWLFYDRSKSGRRRWCDMRLCGNRAKVRRHHQRTSGPDRG